MKTTTTQANAHTLSGLSSTNSAFSQRTPESFSSDSLTCTPAPPTSAKWATKPQISSVKTWTCKTYASIGIASARCIFLLHYGSPLAIWNIKYLKRWTLSNLTTWWCKCLRSVARTNFSFLRKTCTSPPSCTAMTIRNLHCPQTNIELWHASMFLWSDPCPYVWTLRFSPIYTIFWSVCAVHTS